MADDLRRVGSVLKVALVGAWVVWWLVLGVVKGDPDYVVSALIPGSYLAWRYWEWAACRREVENAS